MNHSNITPIIMKIHPDEYETQFLSNIPQIGTPVLINLYENIVELKFDSIKHDVDHIRANIPAKIKSVVDKVSTDWIFLLFSGESLSIELFDFLCSTDFFRITGKRGGYNNTQNAIAFNVPFNYFLLGKSLKHGMLGFQIPVRIFMKDYFSEFKLFPPSVKLKKEKISEINFPVFKKPADTVDKLISAWDIETTMWAMELYRTGLRCGALRIIKETFFAYMQSYVGRKAYLDHRLGVIISGLNSFHRFMIMAKLWELNLRKKQ